MDDGFFSNPKIIAVGDEAAGYFARAVSLACRYGTDGFLRSEVLAETLGGRAKMRRIVPRLVKEKLLHEHGQNCRCMKGHPWPENDGWWIHDFLSFNPSREESDVHKKKKAERRNPNLKAAVRERDRDMCRYCGLPVNWNDHVSNRGGVLDHVDPTIADGIANLVVACKGCNTKKKDRTPTQAAMRLLPEPGTRDRPATDPRLRHGSDPGSDPGSSTTQGTGLSRVETRDELTDTPGRDGTGSGPGSGLAGSGRVGSPSQVGPPSTRRDSEPNPLLRSGHLDADRDPAFQEFTDQQRSPPPKQPDPAEPESRKDTA